MLLILSHTIDESSSLLFVIVARETRGEVAVLGWLAFTDTVRPGAAEMIDDLRSPGVENTIMLTGNNECVAQRIADEVGIDEVEAEQLPEAYADKG